MTTETRDILLLLNDTRRQLATDITLSRLSLLWFGSRSLDVRRGLDVTRLHGFRGGGSYGTKFCTYVMTTLLSLGVLREHHAELRSGHSCDYVRPGPRSPDINSGTLQVNIPVRDKTQDRPSWGSDDESSPSASSENSEEETVPDQRRKRLKRSHCFELQDDPISLASGDAASPSPARPNLHLEDEDDPDESYRLLSLAALARELCGLGDLLYVVFAYGLSCLAVCCRGRRFAGNFLTSSSKAEWYCRFDGDIVALVSIEICNNDTFG